MFDKIETIVVRDPTIYYPKPNVIYKIKYPNIPQKNFEIFFQGSKSPDVGRMNLYYHDYYVNPNGVSQKVYQWDQTFSIESVESLPPHFKNEKIPPILRRVNNSLYYVKKVIFNTNNNHIQEIEEVLPYKLDLWNNEIKLEFQAILGDIPIIAIRGSIFKSTNLPSAKFLHDLYHQFWVFNKKKLADQSKMSADYCHIRAHFVSVFLSLYGIDSIKIYKLWHPTQWSKDLYGSKCWSFHCATLIIDNDNNKWVWDPWNHLSPTLLPLKVWINYKEYPKPLAVILGNRSIINHNEKVKIQWLNFDAYAGNNYRSVFQSMFASAIPNHPALPIKLKNNPICFFQPAKTLQLEYDENREKPTAI